MPHKMRKLRRQRGSRTHGWGQVGQHRKHGMKGGRGMAGLHKHKWSWTIKYAPEYFGKMGFRCPTGRGVLSTLNVEDLDHLAEELVSKGEVKVVDGKYELDLTKLGYEKLLGGGRIGKPMVLKVKLFSEAAARKIEGAGGRILKLEG